MSNTFCLLKINVCMKYYVDATFYLHYYFLPIYIIATMQDNYSNRIWFKLMYLLLNYTYLNFI